jgi:hypothetical protein
MGRGLPVVIEKVLLSFSIFRKEIVLKKINRKRPRPISKMLIRGIIIILLSFMI